MTYSRTDSSEKLPRVPAMPCSSLLVPSTTTLLLRVSWPPALMPPPPTPVTPGASRASAAKSRPASGRSSSWRFRHRRAERVRRVSTSGVVASTVTASVSAGRAERDVNGGRLADRQDQARARERREAVERCRQRVRAGWECGQPVESRLVRDDLSREPGLGVRDGDRDARDDPALAVAHDALKHGAGHLRDTPGSPRQEPRTMTTHDDRSS